MSTLQFIHTVMAERVTCTYGQARLRVFEPDILFERIPYLGGYVRFQMMTGIKRGVTDDETIHLDLRNIDLVKKILRLFQKKNQPNPNLEIFCLLSTFVGM